MSRSLFKSSLAFVLGSLGAFCSCDRDDDDKRATREKERELVEAPPMKGEVPGQEPPRCQNRDGGPRFSFRASKGGGLPELSRAAPHEGGFLLGALRGEGERTASLLVMDAKGGGRFVDLWPVHGPVSPPAVATHGHRVLAVVVDSDASNWTLQLVSTAGDSRSSEIERGPEILRPRRGDLEFSLALSGQNALLVWDDYKKESAHSVLRALPIAAGSLEAQGKPRTVSPRGEDSEKPELVSRAGGFFLVWLSYPKLEAAPDLEESEKSAQSEEDTTALVQEPPAHLRVALLDEKGGLVGKPLTLTDTARRGLVYDAVVDADGRLVVAFRDVPMAGPGSTSPVHLRWLSSDGSVDSAVAEHEALGGGSPALVREPGDSAVHLGTDGRGASYLLGRITAPGRVVAFRPEPGLFGRVLLGGGRNGLLSAHFEGAGVELHAVRCAAAAEAEK